MPPPTATSTSPARIAASRMPTARTLDAHTLLIVSEETSLGMPASIWAWREGICPWPAWRTCPMTTCWTWSGSTPARSRAALIAIPPSSVAWSEERPPPSLPTGVRAVPRITVLDMREHSSIGAEWTSAPPPTPPQPPAPTPSRSAYSRGGGRSRPARRAAGRAARVGRGAHRLPQARAHARRRAPLDRRRARQARGLRPRTRQDRRRRRARPRPRRGRPLAVLGAAPQALRRPRLRLRRRHRHGRATSSRCSSRAPTRTTTAASSPS